MTDVPSDRPSRLTPAWFIDECNYAGRENLDAGHVARYDAKEDASAASEVALLEDMGLTRESHVVEFGPGTGQFTVEVAPACAQVIAVDVSPLMLQFVTSTPPSARPTVFGGFERFVRGLRPCRATNRRSSWVGAGPAGLASAISLARLGIETLLVERRAELSSLPRATAVSLRSMELMRSWGVEDAIRAGGVDVEWRGWQSQTLATVAAGSMWPVGMPTREQAAVLSPTAPACVPQDHLEPVLLEHLRSLGTTRVRLHTEVVGVENLRDGVEVVLRDVPTGDVRTVRARYLVAADGAHSAIRTALGIAMRGPDGLGHVVNALFRAPLWRLVGEHRYGIYSVEHPDGAGTFLPAGRGDRWGYGTWVDPQDVEGYTPQRFVQRIRAGAGIADLEVSIERTGAFSFAAQLADRFRAGHVFLAGDAAHRVTPRGGTGMNTAIRGGHDLGWKLGWVLRGWAGPELLASYEAERRPIAAHNVARSADPNGSTRETADELHVDLGGRIAHVWVHSDQGRVSTLDLLGPGLTLFTGPESAPRQVHRSGGPPVTVRPLDAIGARAMGIRGRGALLVRPDGAPARLWTHEATAAA